MTDTTTATRARILSHAPSTDQIRILKNCEEASIDADGDIWISGPQSGHWMTEDELSRFADTLDSQ